MERPLIVTISPREGQHAFFVMSKKWGRGGGSNDIAIYSRKISHCHLLRAKRTIRRFAARNAAGVLNLF
jgi:hypothetical protein